MQERGAPPRGAAMASQRQLGRHECLSLPLLTGTPRRRPFITTAVDASAHGHLVSIDGASTWLIGRRLRSTMKQRAKSHRGCKMLSVTPLEEAI